MIKCQLQWNQTNPEAILKGKNQRDWKPISEANQLPKKNNFVHKTEKTQKSCTYTTQKNLHHQQEQDLKTQNSSLRYQITYTLRQKKDQIFHKTKKAQ